MDDADRPSGKTLVGSPHEDATPRKPRQALRLVRLFAANRERVFRAWTRPQEVRLWWGPGRYVTVSVEIDARRGGSYLIAMRPFGSPLEYLFGTYLDVIAPERLVMTWTSLGAPAHDRHESLLTIEFAARGGEACEIVLAHERLPAPFSGADDFGWSSRFDKLQSHLSESARPRPMWRQEVIQIGEQPVQDKDDARFDPDT